MIKILGASALLAIAVATPASAQILGGGGLGGSLGGTLGGLGGPMGGPGMLGSTFERSSRDLPIAGDATGSLRGSTRSERSVDTRKGHVKASNETSLDSAIANSARMGDHAVSGTASGSARGSGSADAQLIGTDAVRSAAGNAVHGTRSTASAVRGNATAAVTNLREATSGAVGATRTGAETTLSRVRNAAPNPGDVAAGAAHSASGAVASSSGTLALAGSAAASGAGAFPVTPGMVVTDAKGHAIGTVQSVRTSGTGAVQQVLVRVKDKTATLPAANFTGSGDALVSAMGRGEVRKTAD
ncbi:hypothetical protein [Sphingomonas azotifigens]|uniref:hypothetical protein n=1 Tax=Sphingomonas azotifigens TaxID=330920 RepID=UPI00111C126E|nr:hypothetical protein [Sphingomonas azotifigens]